MAASLVRWCAYLPSVRSRSHQPLAELFLLLVPVDLDRPLGLLLGFQLLAPGLARLVLLHDLKHQLQRGTPLRDGVLDHLLDKDLGLGFFDGLATYVDDNRLVI